MPLHIQQLLSPNHWPGRDGHRPRYVILHGTAGFERAHDCAVYFASQASGVSANYVIGRNEDEDIYQCVSEDDSAWGNGVVTEGADPWWYNANPNLTTISIEHIKPSVDNSDLITPAQERASFALIRAICERHDIPMRPADSTGGITGHRSMDPVNRSRCPGPYPWNRLWAFLGQTGGIESTMNITDPFATRHFEERGGNPLRWHCKTTKCDVIGAILDYWRKTGGAFRLPRSNEIHRVLKDGAAFQVFEAGVLVYDPSRSYDPPMGSGFVYAMHLDIDSPGLRRLMALADLSVNPNIEEASRLIDELVLRANLAKEALSSS